MNDKVFNILKIEMTSEGKYISEIIIDEKHDVFKGHFPNKPILPGVLMIAIIGSVLEKVTNGKRMMVEGENIKYLSVVDPTVDSRLTVDLSVKINENSYYEVKSSLLNGEKTFMKFKGKFS